MPPYSKKSKVNFEIKVKLFRFYTAVFKLNQSLLFGEQHIHKSQAGRRQYTVCCVVIYFSVCVFACSSLVLVGRQVRHHKTSGPHPPASTIPPPPSPLQPLQQNPQTLRGLRREERVHSAPVALRCLHPVPVLRLHSRILLRQSSNSSSSSSPTPCLLPILCLLLAPCPRSASAVGV